jgi:hypothetical protein
VAAGKVSCGEHLESTLTLTHVLVSSVVIRHLDEEGQTDQIPVIYYYFNPHIPETQSCDNFLRSLIFQLLYFSVNIPTAIKDLHARHHLGTRRPSIDSLTSCLVNLLGGHKEVRIVGDAFDRCPEWNKLWKILSKLVQSQHASLRLLFMSRREQYIEDAVRTMNIPSVDLRCQQVDKDIAKYVSDVLRDDSKFSRVTVELKDSIRERLTTLASGRYVISSLSYFTPIDNFPRFHWVALQLDSLRNCRTMTALRMTLSSLPSSLDEDLSQNAPTDGERSGDTTPELPINPLPVSPPPPPSILKTQSETPPISNLNLLLSRVVTRDDAHSIYSAEDTGDDDILGSRIRELQRTDQTLSGFWPGRFDF